MCENTGLFSTRRRKQSSVLVIPCDGLTSPPGHTTQKTCTFGEKNGQNAMWKALPLCVFQGSKPSCQVWMSHLVGPGAKLFKDLTSGRFRVTGCRGPIGLLCNSMKMEKTAGSSCYSVEQSLGSGSFRVFRNCFCANPFCLILLLSSSLSLCTGTF